LKRENPVENIEENENFAEAKIIGEDIGEIIEILERNR